MDSNKCKQQNDCKTFGSKILLNQTEYEKKKLLKPLTWSKKINNYKVNLEGVEFNNLDYDQYMILTKYTDDVE